MRKVRSKILLGFGAMSTLFATGSIIISCGNSNQNIADQQKLAAVTFEMVSNYLKTQSGFIPSSSADVPAAAPSLTLTNATLNGLSGINIAIKNWQANIPTEGSATFDVTLSKTGLTDKVLTGVTYSGWNTKADQQKLDGITPEMVASYVKTQPGFGPSSSADVPAAAPSLTLTNATLNGLSGINIAIKNWQANIPTEGSATFDVTLSKTGLTDKVLTGVTYNGWITADQKALNTVTLQQVVDYVKTQSGFIPSSSADVPAAAPSLTLTNATLNGLSGINIAILGWTPNTTSGSVTFNVTLSKTGLTDKVLTGVTYSGWITDQQKLDGVTLQQVVDYVKTQSGFIPSSSADVPAAAPSSTLTNATLNGLSGINIAILGWTPNAASGSVTFNVTLSNTGLTDKTLTGVTYGGWITTDQKALNEITMKMVADAVALKLAPNTSTSPVAAPANNKFTDISINGLTNVSITISGWTTNFALGAVSFTIISIDKGNATVAGAKFGTITAYGYKISTTELTEDNAVSMKDKLWSYDQSTQTFNIFAGVTSIGDSTKTITGYDWGPSVTGIEHIVLPGSLTIVGKNVFQDAVCQSIKFNGNLPGTSGRTLTLGDSSFFNSPIESLIDGDLATAAQWQGWARTNAADAFSA